MKKHKPDLIEEFLKSKAESVVEINGDEITIKTRNQKDQRLSFPEDKGTEIWFHNDATEYESVQALRKWLAALGGPIDLPMRWSDFLKLQRDATKVIKGRKLASCVYLKKQNRMYKNSTTVYMDGEMVTDEYKPDETRDFRLESVPNFNHAKDVDEFVFFGKLL